MEMPVNNPETDEVLNPDPVREGIDAVTQGTHTMLRSLWDLSKGEECSVHGFHAGLEESYRVRLMELGFHPGEKVTCMQIPRLGAPRLYRVHNTIYALDDHIARQVLSGERKQ